MSAAFPWCGNVNHGYSMAMFSLESIYHQRRLNLGFASVASALSSSALRGDREASSLMQIDDKTAPELGCVITGQRAKSSQLAQLRPIRESRTSRHSGFSCDDREARLADAT
jgi:hypothetical protein